MSKLNRRLLAILMLLLAAVALTIIVKAQTRTQSEEAPQQVTSKLEPAAQPVAPPTEAELAEAQENPWEDEALLKYLGEFRISHYCACKECCGKDDGITATGTVATEGRTIAVDPDVIPYGSRVAIYYDDGRLGYYIAEDCGGGIDGLEADVFIADHDRAWNLGVKFGSVYIVNEE